MTNIAILLPYPVNNELVVPVTEEFESLHVMSIEHAHTDTVVERAFALEKEGCELIIARGVHAQLLREKLSIPLVEMKVTTQELGMVILGIQKELQEKYQEEIRKNLQEKNQEEIRKKLLKKHQEEARKEHLKVALVGYANMFGYTERFDYLFGVELRKYLVTSRDDLVSLTEKAVADGCQALIGGDIVCQKAAETGIVNRRIPAGMESIRNALEIAERVAYAIELSKRNNAEIDAMLNNTIYGIMQVDKEGIIRRINRSCYSFLEYGAADPVGKKATQILTGIDPQDMEETLTEGHETYSVYVNRQNKETVVNMTPILLGESVQGAVLTLQEGQRIIEMDSELRKELYLRGFIARFTIDRLYTGSRETSMLVQQMEKIAPFSAPVLLLGEKGTGAEFIAEALHNRSLLKNSAFVPVDCDAWMPETLDDMLFGNYSPRQNGPLCLTELAFDGTLYLNNVEMLSRESQYKMFNLIRGKFMHNGSHRIIFAKVRVIASTSINLITRVERGEFRLDLYYALSSLSIEIPPLRHQKEYIRYWFEFYMDMWQKQYKRYLHFTQDALRLVEEYEWPGNLAQLASVSERIVLLTERRTIDDAFIRRQIEQVLPAILPGTEKVVLYKDKEAIQISQLLKKYGGNRKKVADELGISKTTLWRRMKRFGIEKDFTY